MGKPHLVPTGGVMTVQAQAWIVIGRHRVAVQAFGVAGVIKGDRLPGERVMAGRASHREMLIWRRVAGCTVSQADMAEDRLLPAGCVVAVGTGAGVMRAWRGSIMAGLAVGKSRMGKAGAVPTAIIMAQRTLAWIVIARGIVTFSAVGKLVVIEERLEPVIEVVAAGALPAEMVAVLVAGFAVSVAGVVKEGRFPGADQVAG